MVDARFITARATGALRFGSPVALEATDALPNARPCLLAEAHGVASGAAKPGEAVRVQIGGKAQALVPEETAERWAALSEALNRTETDDGE